ncbi:hypothetical protein TELCIR_10792, partial [Teladorsagia circumcincta]
FSPRGMERVLAAANGTTTVAATAGQRLPPSPIRTNTKVPLLVTQFSLDGTFCEANEGKECLLYGTPPSSSGVFQTAITSVFKITDEYRVSKPDTRYQIRMSAIQYSQRENHLTDLLSPFSSGSLI